MILVTGASGFLGAHITRDLSDMGLPVRALYHSHPPDPCFESWPGVEWMKADLLDVFDVEAALQGISEIYHAAAIISFDPKRKMEMIHANTEITANVVNAALEAPVRKLIHISSVAALGRNTTSKEINEEAQWEESRLNSGYGLSKYASEMEVWRGMGEGLNACILNPGIILGDTHSTRHWKEGSAKLMANAYKEFPFYTEGVTSFVDVHDVVKAAIALMQSDISEERFILSSGNYPFREITNEMANALGRKKPHVHAGKVAANVVWRWYALKSMFNGGRPLITKETARTACSKSFYNNQKIRNFLPEFNYTQIQETIERMAASFLAMQSA